MDAASYESVPHILDLVRDGLGQAIVLVACILARQTRSPLSIANPSRRTTGHTRRLWRPDGAPRASGHSIEPELDSARVARAGGHEHVLVEPAVRARRNEKCRRRAKVVLGRIHVLALGQALDYLGG